MAVGASATRRRISGPVPLRILRSHGDGRHEARRLPGRGSVKQTVDHMRRPPLPWRREQRFTECGRRITDATKIISRDQLAERLRDWGQQRTSLFTCMTCWQTARRWKTFAEDPMDGLRRECYSGADDADQFRIEMRAVEILVEAHRDEFEDAMAGLERTANFARARFQRQRR